jgi:hypothetical protein
MKTVVRSLSAAALLLMVSAGSVLADAPTPAGPPTDPTGTPVSAEVTPESKPVSDVSDAEKLRTEVVFCIDCSGSMGQSLQRAQQAIRFLIDEMQARTPEAPIRVGSSATGPVPMRSKSARSPMTRRRSTITFPESRSRAGRSLSGRLSRTRSSG